jgi:hypothetical protein
MHLLETFPLTHSEASCHNMGVARIPSIEGGIQPTLLDAKGDLISATANDTPARLAVGANDTVLIAASGETTGLKWGGGWTTWTPSFSNLTVGNGTVTARYQQVGKTLNFEFKFTMGSTSSMGSVPNFSLPATPKIGSGFWNQVAEDAGTGNFYGGLENISGTVYPFVFNATGTYVQNTYFSATAPFTWTTNDNFTIRGTYEVA